MKRVLLAAALVAASVGGVQGAFAQNMPVQERVDLDMTGRIRQEAFQRSQVMATPRGRAASSSMKAPE